ncbi:MAG: RraA family protein [Acidobacteriota bacterium]|nr:RraA family protein [Acidobacteriota bacterium]
MNRFQQLTPEILNLLQSTDTCSVSNAIETLNLRMRDEGYLQRQLQCLLPDLPPVAGYAITGRIRTAAPPVAGLCYYQRSDWWEHVARYPGPKILAVSDMDRAPASAAFVGEIHAEIARALNCVAYVSNGSIRDLPALERMKFQCLAGGVSVSHAYAHLVDFGEPIEIAGLKIATGDILHADRHGVLSIPPESLTSLSGALQKICDRERELIRLCRAPNFTIGRLLAALDGEDSLCLPQSLP